MAQCSYQQIGSCVIIKPERLNSLSHVRFTETYGSCAGGNHPDCGNQSFEEWPISPVGLLLVPLAMAVNDEAAVVLYYEDVGTPHDGWGDLFATVIDN